MLSRFTMFNILILLVNICLLAQQWLRQGNGQIKMLTQWWPCPEGDICTNVCAKCHDKPSYCCDFSFWNQVVDQRTNTAVPRIFEEKISFEIIIIIIIIMITALASCMNRAAISEAEKWSKCRSAKNCSSLSGHLRAKTPENMRQNQD